MKTRDAVVVSIGNLELVFSPNAEMLKELHNTPEMEWVIGECQKTTNPTVHSLLWRVVQKFSLQEGGKYFNGKPCEGDPVFAGLDKAVLCRIIDIVANASIR